MSADGRSVKLMDGENGRTLLRKKDVIEALGVAKSTVSDWITEFQAFVPTVKDGALTLYKPEAVDVLNAIKAMREQNLSKPDIFTNLQQKGFPITVEEAVDDIQKVLGRVDARSIMQQIGTALERIADQEDAIEFVEKRQSALSERQDGQDGRMVELERMVSQLKEELDSARSEIASTRSELEKRKKPWWRFGR